MDALTLHMALGGGKKDKLSLETLSRTGTRALASGGHILHLQNPFRTLMRARSLADLCLPACSRLLFPSFYNCGYRELIRFNSLYPQKTPLVGEFLILFCLIYLTIFPDIANKAEKSAKHKLCKHCRIHN